MIGPGFGLIGADCGVVFDMDGVIVDGELYWKRIGPEFLATLVPSWSADHQRGIHGKTLREVFGTLQGEFGLTLSWEDFSRHYDDLAHEIYTERSSLFPGVLSCLGQLRKAGFRLGLASSSPRGWIDKVLDRFTIRDLFDVAFSSDDVGGLAKPHPQIYRATVEALGLKPMKCVAIEDSPNGIESAKGAGLSCLAFRNGMNDGRDLSAADGEFGSFAELTSERVRALVDSR